VVDPTVLPGFVLVILLFLAPPGPDMAYMVAVGLESGRWSAVRAILGIGAGMSLHAAAVVVGVARIAADHPTALDLVKVAGALYLLRLAWITLRAPRRGQHVEAGTAAARPFARGFIVSATNPKVILFFLAVLPQFVGDADSVGTQLAMLGAVNVLTEVLLYGTIGVLAGGLHARFRESARAGRVLARLAGTVYAVLALVVMGEAAASLSGHLA